MILEVCLHVKFLPPATNYCCGKVMFSQVSVSHSVRGWVFQVSCPFWGGLSISGTRSLPGGGGFVQGGGCYVRGEGWVCPEGERNVGM